jgi:hypothetical protein
MTTEADSILAVLMLLLLRYVIDGCGASSRVEDYGCWRGAKNRQRAWFIHFMRKSVMQFTGAVLYSQTRKERSSRPKECCCTVGCLTFVYGRVRSSATPPRIVLR